MAARLPLQLQTATAQAPAVCTYRPKLLHVDAALRLAAFEQLGVMLHGDFYPGSWLRQPSGIKAIDAEFVTEQRGWRIRNEPLTERERRSNPDSSPASVPWLETSAALPGRRLTYCTGFAEGAAAPFIDAVINGVW